jgi:phosphoribosylformimino-5-aminoimidazole carboxamide ribotide isomerase
LVNWQISELRELVNWQFDSPTYQPTNLPTPGSSAVRIIGVIDLIAGRAVHARAGRREGYQPVRSAAGTPVDGDPVTLAQTYVTRAGLTELYVADLDAIQGRVSQDAPIAAIAALGTPFWLDAGISSAGRARQALDRGATRLIVGLETLTSFESLEEICEAVGGDRIAFSLDLRNGEPIVASDRIRSGESAPLVAARAANAGASVVILIDLVRVGIRAGLDFELIARVREAVPDRTLLAGGGVRGPEDLAELAKCGCDGALVATAIHDGRIGAAEIASAHKTVRRVRNA